MSLTKSGLLGTPYAFTAINTIRREQQFVSLLAHSFSLQIFMEHLLCAGRERDKNEREGWDAMSHVKGCRQCPGHSRGHVSLLGKSSEAFHCGCKCPASPSSLRSRRRPLDRSIKRSEQVASQSDA